MILAGFAYPTSYSKISPLRTLSKVIIFEGYYDEIEPMGYPHLEDFNKEKWCKELTSSPGVKSTTLASQTYSGPTGPHENSFFAKTLATSTTVRACIPMYGTMCNSLANEALMMISLGSDLSSHSSILAGSISSVFLDEVMGLAALQIFRRSDSETFFTVELNVQFIKPIPTPSLVLCRGSVSKTQGRRLWAESSLEDGKGTVCVKGSGVFVKTGHASL